MRKKVVLIINPNAGKGKFAKKAPKIVKNFSKQGYEIETYYTEPKSGPNKIIDKHQGNIDLLICCGGDGTLNEVINAVMKLEKKPELSFIPLGTMNDFAKTIKIYSHRFWLSKKLREPKKVESDIGSFNDSYFNYVAAFGAFTPVPYVTTQKLKRAFGRLAYFLVAFRYIFKIKSVKMKLEVDGQVIEDEFAFGSISNTRYIGNIAWYKKKEVKIDDR